MEVVIIIVFVLGYLAITLEHTLKIDKLIPALVMMAVSWALVSFGVDDFPSSRFSMFPFSNPSLKWG